MKITVFTPTYNRAHTIGRLYYSLQKQTYRNFEWIVIDDGSMDDTFVKFEKILMDDNDFEVIYKKVENGGKHRAINQGVAMATGSMFYIVDSDDFLPEEALQKIVEIEKNIDHKEYFAGIAGKRADKNGRSIGTSFEGKTLDITYLETNKYGIGGDKAEVYYTEVLKKYPFPEFAGEKFLLESVVWNRIASDGFKLRYFNDTIYVCEYMEDGLTAQGDNKFISSPKGYGLHIYQLILYKKVKKINKWNLIFSYYNLFKGKLSIREIAGNLHMNFIQLYLRMLGLKIFYKIYN